MRAAGLGAHHATPVTIGMFALGTMVVTFWFTFAVHLVARYAKDPRRACLRTALPLMALSLAAPLSAAGTATSTRLTIAAAHMFAGAIIIPVVTRRAITTAISSGVHPASRAGEGQAASHSARDECQRGAAQGKHDPSQQIAGNGVMLMRTRPPHNDQAA